MAGVNTSRFQSNELRACGDIDAERTLVRCECGALREAGKPHGYIAPRGDAPPVTTRASAR